MTKELEELGERIAVNAAHIDAAMHRLLADLREFDAKGGWYAAGAVSCAHWLAWRVGWDLATARDRVRVARRLGELPAVDDALRRGELSYSKARAMVRVTTSANEELLLGYARAATAAQLEKICRKYQTVQRSSGKEREGAPPRRYVTQRVLDDGMVRIEAVLHPEEAALVWATTLAAAKAVSAEALSVADGFVAVFQGAARGESTRVPVEVVVTVPEAGLAAGSADEVGELDDGGVVSAETARRLSCDAGIVRVTESPAGEVLDVGRKTRSIPAAIKRALLRRDRTCRFPGCTNTLFVDGHHVRHWADGGDTSLGNLVSLCSAHHRAVHERGFRVELDAAQQPTFYDPRGRVVSPIPPRPWHVTPGIPAIAAANANAGLPITPDTNRCGWDGDPVQYDLAIAGLSSMDGCS